MTFDDLLAILERCDDSSSVVFATGARFIRKLPGRGPLAFLHHLPAPADDAALQGVEGKLGRSIPMDFRAFLARSNGPTLFDLHLTFFGAEQRISRSLRLEDQIAISLLFENETFALTQADRWAAGWMRIGAVSGWNTQHELQASADGRCAIVNQDGATIDFADFGALMELLVDILSPLVPCAGLASDEKLIRPLEAALGGLFPSGEARLS